MTAQDIEDLQHAIWVAERASSLSQSIETDAPGSLDPVYAALYSAAVIRHVLRRHGVQLPPRRGFLAEIL